MGSNPPRLRRSICARMVLGGAVGAPDQERRPTIGESASLFDRHVEIERHGFVLEAHIDLVVAAEDLWGTCHQVVEFSHIARHVIRDPACGVAGPVALLERGKVRGPHVGGAATCEPAIG